MVNNSKVYCNIKITPYNLLFALITTTIVIMGILFLNTKWGINAVENFETLCDKIAKPVVQSNIKPQPSMSIAKPLPRVDVANMNTLLESYLKSQTQSSSVSPIVQEVDIEPCNMIVVPQELDQEQTIVATALEQELANTVLPSTADGRNKLYNDVRKSISENENIPNVFRQRQISDEDARAIVIVMAINKNKSIDQPHIDDSDTSSNLARDLIVGKAESDMPGRGILIELASKTIPVQVNESIANNGGQEASPEVLALFENELRKLANSNSQQKLKYSAHRDIFCHKVLLNL